MKTSDSPQATQTVAAPRDCSYSQELNIQQTLIVVGKMSPPIFSCLLDFSTVGAFKVCFIDTHQKTPPLSSKLFNSFEWLSYQNSWSDCLLRLAATSEQDIYVTCVSYFLAKKIRAMKIKNIDLIYATDTQIALAEDKQLQNKLAEKNNLAVLPSWYVSPGIKIPDDIHYPAVIRPISELSKADFKVEVIDSPQQLQRFSDKYPVVVQPLLTGRKLLIHCARNAENQTIVSIYEVTASFQGLTLALRNMQNPPAVVITSCIDMLKDINFIGVCHFEIIEGKNEWFFLDLNLRLGGTTNKVRFLDNHEGAQLLKAFVNQPLETPPTHSKIEITNKLMVLKALYSIMFRRWTRIDYPIMPSGKLVIFLLKKIIFSRDEIFNFGNIRYSAFKILQLASLPFSYVKVRGKTNKGDR
ncbi:hypothetical protein Q3O60_09190 [Alkalimonas collagenimarina]|uniref:ATP-grasp domain-containing protein n=1 Tax=Alkalimonas collagenimarina TaxID=400390 RepID=A0ABT9GZI0_9GAMM|nr:hypothetical protein [Alkalimonas collagenimarina]MDP4536363.1 hypothetical protein [Alkalimonas collagenimarina]